MLSGFLDEYRSTIIARATAKIADRSAPRATEAELQYGIPLFLSQLVEMLRGPSANGRAAIGDSAAKHGEDLQRLGFTVGQVVHDYGGLCQAITEIAVEDRVPISAADFKILNACLDDAIAAAVGEFGRQRERKISDESVKQLGCLVHELRNGLHTATLAFEVIKTGLVGVGGSTSAIMARSLDRMRELIDRSLAEVRLQAGARDRVSISVAQLIEELAVTAAVEASRSGLQLTVEPVEKGLTVEADPHLLVSALTNLLQNAFKFTRPHGHVSLRTIATADRVRIEIEDECGGLPDGEVEGLFRAFRQAGVDRSGLGLGLGISRQAVEANGGTIAVRNQPGQGCVFSVNLPRG